MLSVTTLQRHSWNLFKTVSKYQQKTIDNCSEAFVSVCTKIYFKILRSYVFDFSSLFFIVS